VNLLLNAADACEGRGRVTIVAARTSASELQLALSDNGPGLPPGLEAQIFEPFFTTKERGHGTGLGLAVCRQLMESFGGGIRAEHGTPGAIFQLRFQVAA
jgi:C4-dicarboxylate-specific signal transduction histidine kinase